MNKRSLFILGFLITLNVVVFAQKDQARKPVTMTALNSPKSIVVDDQDHPYGGTFQIICSKESGKQEVFTTDLLKLVEANRQDNEEARLVVSPVTTIRILSRKQISAADFRPIEKLYSFE
ncbi:MAG TPA: hypothetical protein VF868_12705 [Bacteroidia bacterium]|jgi:hypothetical protein